MFQYFHICTHEGEAGERDGQFRTITLRNRGEQTDIVIKGAKVESISAVRAIRFVDRIEPDDFAYDNILDDQRYEDVDPDDGFYDDGNRFFVDYRRFFEEGATKSNKLPSHFYSPFLHNRIQWHVEPPLEYEVDALIQYTNDRRIIYPVSDCPHCQGKGWFVDIMDNRGSFKTAESVNLVIQKVLKDLMTELYSSVLNLEYGTTLKQTIAANTKEEERLYDDIRLIISEVEDKYLLRQQSEIGRLHPNEILVSLRVENIRRSPLDPRIITIEISVETEEEDRIFRFLV